MSTTEHAAELLQRAFPGSEVTKAYDDLATLTIELRVFAGTATTLDPDDVARAWSEFIQGANVSVDGTVTYANRVSVTRCTT